MSLDMAAARIKIKGKTAKVPSALVDELTVVGRGDWIAMTKFKIKDRFPEKSSKSLPSRPQDITETD